MLDSLSLFNILIVLVSLIVAITLHEAMHAYVGNWLGDDTAKIEGRISLNPLKHVDPLTTIVLPIITLIIFHLPLLAAKPVPFNPGRVRYGEFGAAMIAAAGPLLNLLLAIIGGLIFTSFNGSLGVNGLQIVGIFTMINVGLFIFNMIPIPPLDGSRVLYAFAPEPVQNFMAGLEQYGIFIIFGFLIFFQGFGQFLNDLNTKVINLLI